MPLGSSSMRERRLSAEFPIDAFEGGRKLAYPGLKSPSATWLGGAAAKRILGWMMSFEFQARGKADGFWVR